MASIRDVAKHAGVAISTVSKVLNNYPNVSEDTRQRVNQAIRELGYVPNAVAAALSSKQSGRIALVLNLDTMIHAADEIRMKYLVGALSRARELNLDVITVFFSMLKGKTVEEMISYFRSQSVTGILVFGMNRDHRTLQKLADRQVFKMVLVDVPHVNDSTSCVWIDQAGAQYEVAKKTMEMDKYPYKKVLYISGEKNSFVTEERIRGIRKLAEEYHLTLTVKNGGYSEKRARELTFQLGEKQDMIVCGSDLMAIGAMRALMAMDVFHPVCGFDGITLMGYAGKQMNTVRQDFSRIAEEAAEELSRLLGGGTGREVVLNYELVRLEYKDILI